MTKEEMANISTVAAEYFFKNNFSIEQVKEMSREKIADIFKELWQLNEVPEDIYDAFHEEETFNYFRSNVQFDLAYLIQVDKNGEKE